MPWQHEGTDVALEIDPRTGKYYYGTVLMTVPRQAGKTTVGLVVPTTKCLIHPGTKAWHTSDIGLKARKKVLDFYKDAATSPLSAAWHLKRGAGDTVAEFLYSGSELRPFPPTAESLHQEQSDHVNVDEAWVHDQEAGDALLQAIGPTQATRPGAQTWILSTAGDASSTWFHDMLDAGPDQPRVCVIDWGIPDDADPTDIDLVASYHPAIGHTIDREFLVTELGRMGPDQFARAYGNRRTTARTRAISAEVWEALRSTTLVPAGARTGFGAAVARDRSRTAIVAAAELEDGTALVVVVDSRPGTAWAPARITEIADRYHAHEVFAIDRAQYSAALWDELDRAEVPMQTVHGHDVLAATGDLLDRIRDRRILFRQDIAMDSSVDAAILRRGQRLWDLDKAAAPIPELEAATMALGALNHLEPADTAPKVYFG